MPLHTGGKDAVSYNIHELTHHGSRPRSHEQIVAIALHAAHGNTSKGNEDHHADHNVANAHPHEAGPHPHHAKEKVDVNPHAKTFHPETGVVSGTNHGQYRHHVHADRDHLGAHHPPTHDGSLPGHSVNGGY